jgi:predicted homoserine dehydrogenase-like protein
MPLNIGLIGAGRMGSTLAHHLAFAVDSVNLVAIAIAATRSLDEARPVTVAEVGGYSEGILIKTLDSSLDFH